MIRCKINIISRKDKYFIIIEQRSYTFCGVLILRTEKIIKSNV